MRWGRPCTHAEQSQIPQSRERVCARRKSYIDSIPMTESPILKFFCKERKKESKKERMFSIPYVRVVSYTEGRKWKGCKLKYQK